MPWYGEHELVRVFAKHVPYRTGHLGKVVAEMERLGTPTINVVEWRGDFFAVEGSHRLAAAFHLGLIPTLLVSLPDYVNPDGQEFWERARDTLPHYTWLKQKIG